jgi:hypothetical protein
MSFIHFSLRKLPVCYVTTRFAVKSRRGFKTTANRAEVTCPKCIDRLGAKTDAELYTDRKGRVGIYVGRRFGDLVVKRVMPDGDTIFCVCKCDRTRTLARGQLTGKSISSCKHCASINRKHLSKKRSDWTPSQPKPSPDPVCICAERLVDGKAFQIRNERCPVPGHGWMGMARPWPVRHDSEIQGQNQEWVS